MICRYRFSHFFESEALRIDVIGLETIHSVAQNVPHCSSAMGCPLFGKGICRIGNVKN